MKILFFTQLFYPAIFGGGEYIFYNWAKELVKKGHEVFVITQRLSGTKTNEVKNGIKIFRVGSAPKLSGTLPTGFWSNILFLIGSYLKGMNVCKKYKIDIIHSNTYIPVFSAQWCASRLKIPHIATIHDVYYSSMKNFWKLWSNQKQIPRLSKLIGPKIEKMVSKKNVTLFHTVSEKSKKDLLEMGVSKKIYVIPNGIEVKNYSLDKIKIKNQIIFIGRLIFYKNIGTLIEALDIVAKQIPNVLLIIVGDGPQKLELIEKVRALGLQSNVKFTGNISEEEKILYIHQSRVLVNPSTIEGFGIVVLEGFACGKPVLVSDSKPLSDLITDSKDGFIIPPYNSEEWAKKIVKLLTHPILAEQMGDEGRQKVISQYSISKVTDDLVAMYLSANSKK